MKQWAAIFDWDGVIIDSSSQHERGWQLLAEEEQRLLPTGFFLRSFGMKNDKVIPELLGWTHDPQEIQRLSLRKEALYRQLLQQEGVSLLPGVSAWLNQLRTAAVPCAIGSSTPRENIRSVLDSLGIAGCFRAIVCSEDVSRGKPDPQVFLLAAQRLQASPACCVVFEDAHVGIAAARAAGMKVIGVATTHPADTLQDADRIVQQLDELNLAEIMAWFETCDA